MLTVFLSVAYCCFLDGFGHPSYRCREHAVALAIECGPSILPTLDRLRRHPDAEVRFRAGTARFTLEACEHCGNSRGCPEYVEPSPHWEGKVCPKCRGPQCLACR